MANGDDRRASILSRLQRANPVTQRRMQLTGFTNVFLPGGTGIVGEAVPEGGLDVLEQIAGFEEQFQELGAFKPLKGFGLEGFSTANQSLQRAFKNKTAGVTSVLQALQQGADPASLGLRRTEEIDRERQELFERRESLLLGPSRAEVETPLDRLGQSLLGLQAARGLGQGGSARALQQGGVGQQLQALTFGGLGGLTNQFQGGGDLLAQTAQRAPLPMLEDPSVLGLFQNLSGGVLQRLTQASQEQNRFNTFNPPPFFNLL